MVIRFQEISRTQNIQTFPQDQESETIEIEDKSVGKLDVATFDELDIIILHKFLKEFSYTLSQLQQELVNENKKDIQIETIRKRCERNYVKKGLVNRIKSCVMIYDLNEKARSSIMEMIKEHVQLMGLSSTFFA